MTLEARQGRRARGKILKISLFLFIVVLLVFSVSLLFPRSQNKNTKIISAVAMVKTGEKIPAPTRMVIKQSESLGEAVDSALVGTHGSYGVVVKNLKTGEFYSQNADKTYKSGSLYKLWVMGEVFEKVKDGTLDEDQVLSESVETLNKRFDIDPEYAERSEGQVSYSVKDALNQMITISDNYAALLLTLKIRLSTVSTYLSGKGFLESKVGTGGNPPITTPNDITMFLEKLYDGELADPIYSEKMLDLLKAQRLNDKIPKYIPDGVMIAHKTGELDEVTHDAGIVYGERGDYIIVVMSESDAPQAAAERVAGVSEAVYKYFYP